MANSLNTKIYVIPTSVFISLMAAYLYEDETFKAIREDIYSTCPLSLEYRYIYS